MKEIAMEISNKTTDHQWKADKLLTYAIVENKLSHAYLFHGAAGTGKMEMAKQFAKAIFCASPLHGKACQQCSECRKTDNGNQINLHFIEPDGQSIKIDQIRQLQRDLSYRNETKQRDVYIIQSAEKMTIQAANSLLKFLEEPSSEIVAILITNNIQAILPTIRSRTMAVPFIPMQKSDMLNILVKEGVSPTLARTAIHASSGIEGARQLLEKNGFAEIRTLVIQLGKESVTKYIQAMVTAQQKLFKSDYSEDISLVLQLLLLWYKDMTQFQAGRQESIVFTDQLDWISAHAFSRSFDGWLRCIESIIEADKRIKANVTPQLSFEQLLVNLQEG